MALSQVMQQPPQAAGPAPQGPMPPQGGPPVGGQPPAAPGNNGPSSFTAEDRKDLKIAVLLGERLLRAGGFDVIQKAVKSSSDPGQVIGQFLLQMGQQMMEKMPANLKLSPRILLCHGGWLEKMSDFIQEKLGVPKQVMDKAEIYVASTATQMAHAKQQQGNGAINGVQAPPVASPGQPQVGGPPQGGPVMPQGGPR